jgi:hypothetical protein
MALQKTFDTPQGFVASNAYVRVEGIRITNKTSMTFQVRFYKDSNTEVPFSDKEYGCAYDLNGANAMRQAYEHLKTLEEFAGAQDC